MTSNGRTKIKQGGLALVTVLWVLLLLSVIGLNLSQGSRSEALATHYVVEDTKAGYLADAGVQYALWNLFLPPEEQWLADGQPYVLELGGRSIDVQLYDESGKIDLNTTDPGLLLGLFAYVGLDDVLASSLVDAIQDWRDADSLKRLNGAEDDDYADAGLSYGARDAPFETVEELRRVLGMTEEIYRAVAPALTVYSYKRGINPELAPRLVLLAFPEASESEVDRYIEERRQNHDNGMATAQPSFIVAQYISPTVQGVNYTIHTRVTDTRQSGYAMEVQVRRRGGARTRRFEILTVSKVREQSLSGERTWKDGDD